MENGYGREVRRNSYGQPVHEHYPQRWNTNQYQNSYQRGSQNQQFYQPSNHNNPHNYHQVPYVPPTNQNPNFFYDNWQEQQQMANQSFRSSFPNSSMTQDSYREDGVASNWGEVGRFGKFDQPPKKKKKKNKPKVDPPKPKLKIPSIGQLNSNLQTFIVRQQQIDFAICPFQPGHIMPKSSLLRHIGRCKQTEHAQGYKPCQYNPLHYYRFDLIEAHQVQCQDRPMNFQEHFMVKKTNFYIYQQEPEPRRIYEMHPKDRVEKNKIKQRQCMLKDQFTHENVREYEYALIRDF